MAQSNKMTNKLLFVFLIINMLTVFNQDFAVEGLLCFDLSCASKMNALENQIARLIDVCRLNNTNRQSNTATNPASNAGNLIDA